MRHEQEAAAIYWRSRAERRPASSRQRAPAFTAIARFAINGG